MTLKEQVYQAVHDYVSSRITQLDFDVQISGPSEKITYQLVELLRIQNLIYKMFSDYNTKLAQQSDIKPVRINTNEFK